MDSPRDADLGPYPKHGTKEEKQAWAKAYTALHSDPADTGWEGEDPSVPLLEFTVDNRSGELIALREVPREVEPVEPVTPSPRPRAPRPRQKRTTARTRGARGDPSPSSLAADLAARLPREHGGVTWCLFCPQFWAQAGSRGEALDLVDNHMRVAHPDEVPR